MDPTPPARFPHRDPWESESLDLRLSRLAVSHARVAWIYERPDTSTFRYRVYNMVQGLAGDERIPLTGTWFSRDEIPFLLPRIPELSALVLVRVRYSTPVAALLSAARAHGVPVLFDCDDLVFDTRHVHLLMQTLAQDTRSDLAMDTWFAHISRLEAVARLCDGGITTNDHLAGQMRKVVPGPVQIVPNFLNKLQHDVSDILLEERVTKGWKRNHTTRIGYFSGTPSHANDFAIVAPALARLLKNDTGIRLRIVGFLDALGPLEAHRDRIEFFPLQDFVNLQTLIAGVDINIAPLQSNLFTNCKSELKYFEAAAVGTWTLASPTPVFEKAIDSPRSGRLVKAHEWDEALTEAVDLARRPSDYGEAAMANAETVRQKYGWDRFAAKIQTAVLR